MVQERPDLMALLEGGNDILRNQRSSRIKENLAQMIEVAKQQNVQVVMLGVPSKNLFSGSASFYTELAEEYNLVFDGDLIRELLLSPSYKSDSVHLNAAGYRALAEGVYKLLEDNGALLELNLGAHTKRTLLLQGMISGDGDVQHVKRPLYRFSASI